MTSTARPADPPTKGAEHLPDHVDVLVVGAGLSGIGAAVRIREANPDASYVVLEGRAVSGGTWDLFRYPGVRSDSDMYTLSFPFRPWVADQAVADGPLILDYLRDTARERGVEEHIHYGCRVIGAAWSTPDQRWSVDVESEGPDGPRLRTVTAGWVHLGCGYYDYEEPHDAGFAGLTDFAGDVVHPQAWPEGLELSGRRAVVIGSGATAVSLLPALARETASTVMLQRTPSYVFAIPEQDGLVHLLRRVLPPTVVHRLARAKNIAVPGFLYRLSRWRPAAAKALVLGALRKELPEATVEEHFTPPYDVWDQRLCAVRGGDLFESIREGDVEVVTGHVERFVPEGIRLTDGRVVEADLVVTATGLRLKALGGISLTVDGVETPLAGAYAYRGLMLGGVPNVSMTVGYINASWTLRADLVSRYVARLLRHLREHDLGVAVPVAPEGMSARPVLDIDSGYVQRSIGAFPKVGDRVPWTMPQSYVHDVRAFRRADVTQDMYFVAKGDRGATLPRSASAPAHLDLPGSSSNVDDSPGDVVVEVAS